MKTLHQTNCEIFDIVKEKELILYSDLRIIGANSELILQSISKLSKDHGLISVKSQKLSLSEKGLKHKSFELYMESLDKKPVDKYKIATIIISLFALYLGYLNYDLKRNDKSTNERVSELKIENDSLKNSNVIYKDSVAELKEQLKLLQIKASANIVNAKNLTDLKAEKDLKNE